MKIEKKENKTLKTFQKLLEYISQSPQYNQRKQGKNSRGNVFEETGPTTRTRHIWKYWYHS